MNSFYSIIVELQKNLKYIELLTILIIKIKYQIIDYNNIVELDLDIL